MLIETITGLCSVWSTCASLISVVLLSIDAFSSNLDVIEVIVAGTKLVINQLLLIMKFLNLATGMIIFLSLSTSIAMKLVI